jgi:UDP-N-acetylmuramyl-tripeptide synthetase
MGTIGAYFNNDFMPIPWTTPESPVLQELVATHGRSARYLSMEVSSHGVKEKRIYGCRFRGLAFTNLTQDHLDYHRTFDDYYDTKKRFFTEYAKPEGSVAAVAVQAPYGNRLFHDLQRENPTLNLVSVGLESQEKLFDFHARVIEESLEGTTFELAAKGQPTHRLKTSLVGRYNVSNVTLAAALAVRTDSLPWHRLPEAIEKLAAPPGRLERVRLPKSPNIFVDYAHTPDALENVLKLMCDLRPKGSRTVVVFGCGGNRDTKKRPEMGRVAAQLADEVVLTSDNSRSERPEDIIADIEKGIQSQKVHRCPDRREALATAYRLLHPGDVLIVAGKGHETTQTDQQGTRHFSDTEELKRLQHD